jgi:hypothetical protein
MSEMRTIRPITEHEMVAVFLKGELDSPRFRPRLDEVLARLGLDHEVIASPDVEHPEQNDARSLVLGEMHGYQQERSLFRLFPNDVLWERALFDAGDLRQVYYIDYSYWNELSSGSRRPEDGARAIEQGVVVYGQRHELFWELVVAMKSGARLSTPIVVTHDRQKLVVLEGHLRLTAYMHAPEFIPDQVEVILGTSRKMTEWPLY